MKQKHTKKAFFKTTAKTPSEEFFYSVAQVYVKSEKIIVKFLSSYKITIAQFNVLAILAKAKKDLTQIEISKKILVSQGNITRLLERMLKTAFIIRKEDSSDRRKKLISISPKGRQLYNLIVPSYNLLISDIVGSLSKKEKLETTSIIKNLTRAIDEKYN